MRRTARAIRRAWIAYRIRCATDELNHYWDAGVAGPRYICAMLAHLSDLDSTLKQLQEGGSR